MQIPRLIRSPSTSPTAIVPAAREVFPGRTERVRAALPLSVQGNIMDGGLVGHALGGRYHVRSVIGDGGKSIVYRAFDQRLGRDVAIKVIATRAAAADGVSFLRARFAREARVAAGIRHPNVLSIFDQGTDASLGIDFLVMELLEGQTLGKLIRKLGLPRLSATVRLLRQAAAGLAAGHRAGLVHRDVSPDNLFLESNGSEVRLKVLAFGAGDAGRFVDLVSDPAAPNRTTLLSPSFSSPEQLRGDHPLTTASDVFSLGAVAHHLVTGDHLSESFEANRALREMEAAREALLQDRSLPLKLREVIGQALASHPADRFGDARELLIALDGVRVGEAVESSPDAEAIDGGAVHLATAFSAPGTKRPPSVRHTGGSSARPYPPSGTGAVLLIVGAIGFLTLVAGQWNTMTAAMIILAVAAFRPHPGEARFSGIPAHHSAFAAATLVLLGVMVARAIEGSIPDLLAAHLIISRLFNWLTPPAGPGQREIS